MPDRRFVAPMPLLAMAAMLAVSWPQLAAAQGLDRAAVGDGARLILLAWHPLVSGLAVGVWASQLGERTVWQLPVAYIAGFLATAGLLLSGGVPPGTGWAGSATLIALGVVIAVGFRPPVMAAVALVMFAGYAHGLTGYDQAFATQVMTGGDQAMLIATLAGMAAAMFMTVVGGIGISVVMRSATTEMSLRVAGVMVALLGLLLLDLVEIKL